VLWGLLAQPLEVYPTLALLQDFSLREHLTHASPSKAAFAGPTFFP
jgi:hypothetical protein